MCDTTFLFPTMSDISEHRLGRTFVNYVKNNELVTSFNIKFTAEYITAAFEIKNNNGHIHNTRFNILVNFFNRADFDQTSTSFYLLHACKAS